MMTCYIKIIILTQLSMFDTNKKSVAVSISMLLWPHNKLVWSCLYTKMFRFGSFTLKKSFIRVTRKAYPRTFVFSWKCRMRIV